MPFETINCLASCTLSDHPYMGRPTSACSLPSQTSSLEKGLGCLKDEMETLQGTMCHNGRICESRPYMGSSTLGGVQIKTAYQCDSL